MGIGCCIIAIAVCGAVCSKNRESKKRPKRLDNEDIKKSEQTENELSISININNTFESGQWSSRYYQYLHWHGPFKHEITFNIEENTLSGYGIDDIGQFTLTGNISTELLIINIRKQYRLDTGNENENLGHAAKIDLKWNNEQRAFVGKWSVNRYKYEGEDSYELVKVQQQSFKSEEQDSPV